MYRYYIYIYIFLCFVLLITKHLFVIDISLSRHTRGCVSGPRTVIGLLSAFFFVEEMFTKERLSAANELLFILVNKVYGDEIVASC